MAFRARNQTPNPGSLNTLFLKIAGWSLARAPESLARALAYAGGAAVLALSPRRRRLMHSNLHHAFPQRSEAWRRRIAAESSRRLVETGLLSLAAPFFNERRIRRTGVLAPSVVELCRELAARPRPTVLATLHLSLWETQTWLLKLSPTPLPEFGIIFRPLDDSSADAFFLKSRERFGMRLLSRREGFAEALRILRGSGCVGVLFDQNAGLQGALTLLFERVCSTTELPGLMAAKFGAEVRTYYPRRTAFWRVAFESAPITSDGTTEGVTLALNRWFETAITDEPLCASWLWAHDRWRNQDIPARRLRLEAKRTLLDADLAGRSLDRLPRRTRIWIRLPNWLGDVVLTLPLLRALRLSRPDAELTLVAQPAFLPLLKAWGVGDRLEALPARGPGYFAKFLRLRAEYPDTWILFTQSVRGDLEARLAGCPQRFGIVRGGRKRPLLTHAYRPPEPFDEAGLHQMALWTDFLRHFGLKGDVDLAPFARTAPAEEAAIGLIAGSENSPEKRWPIDRWRRLIAAFPDRRWVLFGTRGDAPITRAIAEGFPPARVEDAAGRTSLPEYAARLAACGLIVANDTGGMHLANALGVPLIGLFGPTNPVRTGPVFRAPARILQPPGCDPRGGGSLGALEPETVAAAIAEISAP